MTFQLVRASDSEIVVWHVDQGHIFIFAVPETGAALIPGPVREAPDAAQPASMWETEALAFATEAARSRLLIV